MVVNQPHEHLNPFNVFGSSKFSYGLYSTLQRFVDTTRYIVSKYVYTTVQKGALIVT